MSEQHFADEHEHVANLINQISYLAGDEGIVHKTLMKAADAWADSVNHHNAGNYKSAHNALQIAAQHIGTAANLGKVADKNYGYSMPPQSLAEAHARSYKHAYIS